MQSKSLAQPKCFLPKAQPGASRFLGIHGFHLTAHPAGPQHCHLGLGLPTFFFFFRMTFTPSTDTTRFTFFFLMFLALNSYCRERPN